jgi:hypothetical protein
MAATLAWLAAFTAHPAAAQSGESEMSLAEVQQELARMSDSAGAAFVRVNALRQSFVEQPDGLLTEGGVHVQYPTVSVTEEELRRVRRAIRRARAALTREFGAAGSRLLEGDTWQITTTTAASRRRSVRIRLGTNETSAVIGFPLATHTISQIAIRRASVRALALHPAIAAFARGAPVLAPANEQYYTARRELVAGRSGPARRCATGSLPACDDLLSDDPARWHDGEPPKLGRLQPVTRAVHGSMVALAIQLRGEAALDALRAGGPADAEPVALLAGIVGLPREEFLRQWYTQVLDESRRHAVPSLPLSLTSLAWCGMVMVVVGRRRPR